MLYTNNNKLVQILTTRKGAGMSVAGVTIIMVVIMLVFAILPAYSSITDQLKNNEAKTVYLNELQLKKETMDNLNNEFNSNQKTINKYDTYINSDSNSDVLLANFNAMAIKYNTTLVTYSIVGKKISEDPTLTEFSGLLESNITLGLIGTLPNLSLFLSYLESYPIPINISDIAYSHYIPPNKEDTDKEELISQNPEFLLSINANYYLWEQTQ